MKQWIKWMCVDENTDKTAKFIECYIYTWTPNFPYQGSTARVSLKYQLLLDLTAFICTSTSKTLLRNQNTSDIHGNRVNELPQHYSSGFSDFTIRFTKLHICDHSWNWPRTTLITQHRNIMVAPWPDSTQLNKYRLVK